MAGERCCSHARATCEGGAALALRDGRQRPSWRDQLATAEREPEHEADPLGCAMIEETVAAAVRHVVEVLHAHDAHDTARPLELLDGHLRQAHVADEALLLHLPHRTELILLGDLRVDSVELPEIDAIHP